MRNVLTGYLNIIYYHTCDTFNLNGQSCLYFYGYIFISFSVHINAEIHGKLKLSLSPIYTKT